MNRLDKLYEVLGVPKDATDDQIKKAYRDLSRIHHPDTPTGDKERFREIAAAYEILRDPEKKANYEMHGESFDLDSAAISAAIAIFESIINEIDSSMKDLGAAIQNKRNSVEGVHKAHMTVKEREKRKFEKLRSKIKKKPKNDFLSNYIDSSLERIETDLNKHKSDKVISDRAFELLHQYVFESPSPGDNMGASDFNAFFDKAFFGGVHNDDFLNINFSGNGL